MGRFARASKAALFVGCVCSPLRAFAEPVPAAAPTGAIPAGSVTADTVPTGAPRGGPRAPASGFQAIFRTGALIPMGGATGAAGDSLGRRYAWQIPIVVDLGWRFAESFFAGGYLGAGFGSTGSDAELEAACRDDDDDLNNDIACSAYTLRAGLEAQYSFQPGERINPWVGYGFGIESSSSTLTDYEHGYQETVTAMGLTYAQLSAGFDARYAVGFGPFVEAALGEFTKTNTDVGSSVTRTPVADRALHGWLTLGLRLVVNP
jgi:hypothetical protein